LVLVGQVHLWLLIGYRILRVHSLSLGGYTQRGYTTPPGEIGFSEPVPVRGRGALLIQLDR
jgi:hypothetical protein